MKNYILFFGVLCFIFSISCNKNDDSVSPEIKLQNEPPLSFNLLEVADGTTEVDVLPTLSWESAKNPEGGEVTYDLYLGKEANPTNLYQGTISETSFQIEEGLDLVSEYHWKVVAKDAEGQTSQSGINSFTTRNLMIPEQPVQANTKFPDRISHTCLSFNDQLWVLGGTIFFGQAYNDVWSSDNGIDWNEVGSNILINTKRNHTSVVYDNKMWILGGWTKPPGEDSFVSHDVWSSNDGVTWNNMTSYTDFFPARVAHTSIVFNNKIYVIGGVNNEGVRNDVWQYDGNWSELMLTSSRFTARSGHASVVFDDKIWVIGGFDGSERKNDVWYSSDGANWHLATTEADFPPINGQELVVFGGKMWLLSIHSATDKYWYSENGVEWTSIEIPEGLHGRYGQSATVHNDKLYLTGGSIEMSFQASNDVWILE